MDIRQIGLLKIVTVDGFTPPHPTLFEDWFVSRTQELFLKNETPIMRPLACMQTTLVGCIFIYPDFTNDTTKRVSMNQIRILAQHMRGLAYAFVSEGYMRMETIPKGTNREEYKKNVDPQVSKHPNSKEALMCHLEIKDGDRIKKSLITWPIIHQNNKRELGPVFKMSAPDEVCGTVGDSILS